MSHHGPVEEAHTSSSSFNSTSFDVVIVGAGFTGCAAAIELRRRGLSVAVVDAATRVGGRVYSFDHEGPDGQVQHFEHGAQFVGEKQPRIMRLIQELMPEQLIDGYEARLEWRDQVMLLNNRRFVYDRDDCLFGIGGVPPELDLWDVLAAQLLIMQIQAIEQAIDVVEPWSSPDWVTQWDDKTLDEFIRQPWVPPLAASLMRVSVQAVLSVNAAEISAMYFFWYCACNAGFLNLVNDEQGGPQQFYLRTGMQSLLEAWLDREQAWDSVHLGYRVRSLSQDAEGVDVHLEGGTSLRAGKVIVAT